MSNEIWFKHKPGLIVVGRPVHWKGWATGLLFGAAFTATILIMVEIALATPPNERLVVWVVGYAIAPALAVAFTFAAWPHRAPRPK
jgi:Mg/Co/Ni transporter MgtE